MTRENELTKTAQQDNADTRRPTTQDAYTRRKAKREARRQRRYENTNPRDTNGTLTRDERRDERRDETLSPHPLDTRDEKKRHTMPSPPPHGTPPAGIYPRRRYYPTTHQNELTKTARQSPRQSSPPTDTRKRTSESERATRRTPHRPQMPITPATANQSRHPLLS